MACKNIILNINSLTELMTKLKELNKKWHVIIYINHKKINPWPEIEKETQIKITKISNKQKEYYVALYDGKFGNNYNFRFVYKAKRQKNNL